MNAPLIWVVIPAIGGVIFWLIRGRKDLVTGLAVALCLLLVLLAWQIPVGESLKIGSLVINLEASMTVLGRRFIFSPADRYYVIAIYSAGSMWFFVAQSVKITPQFIPLGMLFLALMVAAQTVEPFLYAALLILMAVQLSVPMLVSPESQKGFGIQRYVVFQTMAVPFILLAGWAAGIVEQNPSASPLLSQATFLLALGFAFWLAVFPFNTWIPMLTSQVHPLIGSFVLTILFSEVFFFFYYFLDGFIWMRTNALIPIIMRAAGVITVVTAGLWAAFQTDLRRLLGYGVIIECGLSLVGLGISPATGIELFSAALIPRIVGLALWGLALSVFFRNNIPLTIGGVAGGKKTLPYATTALIVACFSFGGLPLLAGFPVRQVILENLAHLSLNLSLWLVVGAIGFLTGAVRMMIRLLEDHNTSKTVSESRLERVLLVIGVLAILIMGLFPKILMPIWTDLAQVFKHLY